MAPYLHVRRPSPTTAEFTVWPHPPPSLAGRLLQEAQRAGRLALAVLLAALLYLRLLGPPRRLLGLLPPAAGVAAARIAAARIAAAVAAVPAWALAVAAGGAAMYAATRPRGAPESLLVLRGLGVQTSSGRATRFIPTRRIRDVLVAEGFVGFAVRYYLVLVVDGDQDLVVVFPRLLPGRAVVQTVWAAVRTCLWESERLLAAPPRPTGTMSSWPESARAGSREIADDGEKAIQCPD